MTLASLALLLGGLLAACYAATRVGVRAVEARHPPQGRFVEAGGGRLHVIELGPREAPPDLPAILLIHGASGNAAEMRLALGERLAERFRVLMPDRPGHGWSDRPGGDAEAAPAAQAARIREAVVALGARRVVVVGHSLGGAVAAAYALGFPGEVTGLVTVNGATHPWPGRAITWYYHLVRAPLVGRLFVETLAFPIGRLVMGAVVRSVFAPQTAPPDYARKAAIALVLTPERFRHNAADVAGLYDAVARQSLRYREIAAPTLVVAGARDETVWPQVHSRPLAGEVRDGRLVWIEEAGHMPHHSHAAAIVDEIARLARRD